MKAFRWRSLVTLVVAVGVLVSAWPLLGQISDGVDADHGFQEIVVLPTALAAALLLFLAILSLFVRRTWLAGLRLLVGIWFLITPWILSQAMGPLPKIIIITGGIAVVAIAVFDLVRDAQHEGDALSHMS